MNCSATSKKLCGKYDCSSCYERSFISHPKAKFWSSKNLLKPIQVFKNSNKKYLFDCADCGHEIEMMVKNVSIGQWCNYCNRDGLCNNESCQFCYNKSFASHPMAKNWSNKNDILPRNILKGSERKILFDCDKCNHSFESKLFSVSSGTKCPYCTNQKLCQYECDLCFNKTCASHEMAKVWSQLNNFSPREIFLQSNKKIIFNCSSCSHQYETTPNHYYNRNGSCPYCANKYLCSLEDCQKCYDKSFASHHFANCWSDKNNNIPRNVFKGSETKFMFNCNTCNSEFESKLYNVLTGYWCPYCKNKTEAKLLSFLKENYTDYKSQLRFNWCRYSKTDNIMPFDFGFNNDKILIELDGDQHFKQVSNWDSPESVQEKDIEKINYSIKNGYSVIHIYQNEVWNDIYDWKTILKNAIENLKENKNYKVIFISCCDIYSSHISKLDASVKYRIINPKF